MEEISIDGQKWLSKKKIYALKDTSIQEYVDYKVKFSPFNKNEAVGATIKTINEGNVNLNKIYSLHSQPITLDFNVRDSLNKSSPKRIFFNNSKSYHFYKSNTLRFNTNDILQVNKKNNKEESELFLNLNNYSGKLVSVNDRYSITLSPELISYIQTFTGPIFSAYHGNLMTILIFNFNVNNNPDFLEKLVDEKIFYIHLSSSYIIDGIRIYPEPDYRDYINIVYNNPEKIKELLRNGIQIGGTIDSLKRNIDNLNSVLSLIIGAVLSIIITIMFKNIPPP